MRILNKRTKHSIIQPVKTAAKYLNQYDAQFITMCALGVLSTSSVATHNSLHEYNQRHLLIELTPAMCALYPVRANSLQCLNHYHVTVEGLDLGYRCTSSTTPVISPVQRRVLQRVMPDRLFVNQTWRRYGACSPYDSKNYFRELNDVASALNIPNRLNQRRSFVISKKLFIEDMKRANPDMTADNIQLACEPANLSQPILTKMKICYSGDNFAECELDSDTDTCGDNFVIWGSHE